MTPPKKPWDEEGYGDIVGAKASYGVIDINFANGDVIELAISDLGLSPDTDFRVDEKAGSLIAITPTGEREIDWMVIRARDDPSFAQEVRERDAEEARRIGNRLRVLRENRGLSQKAVAEMLNMKPPQLARIEIGKSDLRVSTVRSVLRAIGASFADIAGPEAPEMSIKELSKTSGAPLQILQRIAVRVDARDLPGAIAHGFRWNREKLLNGVPDLSPLGVSVAFKTGASAKRRSTPIERLARTLSEIAAAAYSNPIVRLPTDPAEIRSRVIAKVGEVSLAALTRWAWEKGVVVMPMSGPGFEAATWYVDDRPVILLKVSHDLEVYWLFTLAHELGHLVLGHVKQQKGLVEVDEPGKVENDKQEDEANAFARHLLVPESERLFAEIRERTKGPLQYEKKNFKGNMVAVAKRENLNPALLGIVAAFAMGDIAEPGDRWGSAINIAKRQTPARPVVQAEFENRIDTTSLSEFDAALMQAVVLE